MAFKNRIVHNNHYYFLQGDFETERDAENRARYLHMHYWSTYYRTKFTIEVGIDNEGNYRWLLYMRKWGRPFDIKRTPLEIHKTPVKYGRWRKY